MTNKSKRWFFSALFGVAAVAFGFWLGISVLKWYSESEMDSEDFESSRPVSILSSKPRAAMVSNEILEEITDTISDATNENDEGFLLSDSLNIANSEIADSLFSKNEKNEKLINSDTKGESQSLEDYHFIKKDKDQLVANLSFSLPKGKQQEKETTLQLDSILGSRPQEPTMEDLIIVELWKSPLKFRGYKYSNNVLVVYDLTQIDALKLFFTDGKLYLSYYDMFYLITPTKQFRPLTPTSKPLIKE
jgi:hypothetical protein